MNNSTKHIYNIFANKVDDKARKLRQGQRCPWLRPFLDWVVLSDIETSSNKSSFLQYLPLFWPVLQSRAAVEPNLSLSQNTPISI